MLIFMYTIFSLSNEENSLCVGHRCCCSPLNLWYIQSDSLFVAIIHYCFDFEDLKSDFIIIVFYPFQCVYGMYFRYWKWLCNAVWCVNDRRCESCTRFSCNLFSIRREKCCHTSCVDSMLFQYFFSVFFTAACSNTELVRSNVYLLSSSEPNTSWLSTFQFVSIAFIISK